MPKTHPLQTLLDLSQLRLDNAARMLGELLAKEMEASERAELLERYRAEYQARFLAAAKSGIGLTAWSNYQSFLARLDDAITQSQTMVAASRQRTLQGQQAWLKQRSQVKAFDTLSRRHMSREQKAQDRQEQKFQDEHGARVRGASPPRRDD